MPLAAPMKSGRSLLAVTALTMWLGACAAAPSEVPSVATPAPLAGKARPGCPIVAEISRADQAAIWGALAALPASSPIWILIKDDLKMRDEARACRS